MTLGHNRGPSMAPGEGWRRHCWTEARRELLPRLPLEVVRLRVGRARELGLDFRTYANVHAACGRDIVAFLFSSNALRLIRPGDGLPDDRARKLADLRACGLALLAQPPLDPLRLAAGIEARHGIRLDGVAPAPAFAAAWREIRAGVLAALEPGRLPARAVLLVGDTAIEREWCAAARLAGYLAADRYFPAP
jgi:hypothetical protein